VIELTRHYRFPAAHVLRSPQLTAAENERVYGKCANPAGHGHDYGLEVTVAGPVDAETGRILAPELLDRIVEERVLRRFGYRMLNEDPLFAALVPTAENIARVVHDSLEVPISERSTARLRRVRVIETRRNTFDYGEEAEPA
jgi:6-pyruvoyltetrahydropterin/6-carboxytetrahydropterin synthase